MGAEQRIEYPFPLRPSFTALVVVPRDLTAAEADRLCGMIRTLPTQAGEKANPDQRVGGPQGDAGKEG